MCVDHLLPRQPWTETSTQTPKQVVASGSISYFSRNNRLAIIVVKLSCGNIKMWKCMFSWKNIFVAAWILHCIMTITFYLQWLMPVWMNIHVYCSNWEICIGLIICIFVDYNLDCWTHSFLMGIRVQILGRNLSRKIIDHPTKQIIGQSQCNDSQFGKYV